MTKKDPGNPLTMEELSQRVRKKPLKENRNNKKSPLTDEELIMNHVRGDVSDTEGIMRSKRSSGPALAGLAGALIGLGLIAASSGSSDQKKLTYKKTPTVVSDNSSMDDDPDDYSSYFETSDPDELIEEYKELEVSIAIKKGRWAKKDAYHEELERYIFDGGLLD